MCCLLLNCMVTAAKCCQQEEGCPHCMEHRQEQGDGAGGAPDCRHNTIHKHSPQPVMAMCCSVCLLCRPAMAWGQGHMLWQTLMLVPNPSSWSDQQPCLRPVRGLLRIVALLLRLMLPLSATACQTCDLVASCCRCLLLQNVSHQKVRLFGEAFAKIQEATGISDIDDLVKAFATAEVRSNGGCLLATANCFSCSNGRRTIKRPFV